MYRSYLLKNEFWAKKGNERSPDMEKVFIKHELGVGGIYAKVVQRGEKKGVNINVNGEEHFFNNFDKLDVFLNNLKHRQDDFIRILRRKNISRRLRTLEL